MNFISYFCPNPGMKKILNCMDNKATYTTLWFVDYAIEPDALTFEQGKTYYFIGTGFRSIENVNQTVNGSCSQTDVIGKHKLKLEVYVCRDSEKCEVCKSAGCYYRHCYCQWTGWTSSGMFTRRRTCRDDVFGETRQEDGLDGGGIAGILVCMFLLGVVFTLVVWFFCHRHGVPRKIEVAARTCLG